MQLYANPNRQADKENCAEFERFMRRFEWANFFQPNAEKSPWHVQCRIQTDAGYDLTLNFWPHKMKGQYGGYGGMNSGTYEGLDGLRGMMAKAIDDCRDCEDFDVIEG